MNLLRKPLRVAYRVLGSHYLKVLLFLQFQVGYVIVLGGIGLLALYESISTTHLLVIIAVAAGLTLIESLASLSLAFRRLRPAEPWLRGDHSPESASAAWRAIAGLPAAFISHRRAFAVLLNVIPLSLFIYYELSLPLYALPVLVGASLIVLLYAVVVRYFTTELITRPVLEAISRDLAGGVPPRERGVSLKLKLLLALPAINVITGFIVAAISTRGHGHLDQLGVNVLFAVGVALTVSFELTVLLSRSILEPLADLHEATNQVSAGDYSVRVPVITADETGALSESFNRMVGGLEERERLLEAFGTYVDPDLAERVLAEGAVFEGEEVEVSVLFLDIRDFTAFAERSSAAEVVAQLNEFYELVVPVIVDHGGHANKFIGDGLLAVFGAPNRMPDHADQVVAAACEIGRLVQSTYGARLRIGIGVNSGPVVAGAIGGGGHLEFTVIGDAVNTAARVESVTRETGDQMLITEATRCLLSRDHGGFAERPPVELKGKTETVALYAALALGRVEPWQPTPSRSPSSTAAD